MIKGSFSIAIQARINFNSLSVPLSGKTKQTIPLSKIRNYVATHSQNTAGETTASGINELYPEWFLSALREMKYKLKSSSSWKTGERFFKNKIQYEAQLISVVSIVSVLAILPFCNQRYRVHLPLISLTLFSIIYTDSKLRLYSLNDIRIPCKWVLFR